MLLLLCCLLDLAAAAEPRAPLPKEPLRLPVVGDGHLVLTAKLADATHARVGADGLTGVAAVDDVAARYGLGFSPLIRLSDERLRALELRAERRSGRAQPDLATMVQVRAESEDALVAAGEALLALDEVEWAYLTVRGIAPPDDIAPETPLLDAFQTYRGPEVGIDSDWANSVGYFGEDVRISDCEYAWVVTHEDLVDIGIIEEPNQTPTQESIDWAFDQHGAAVVGELAGSDNDYGVTGLVPAATIAIYSEWTVESDYRREDAIANAVADSIAGDVVLLEMQDWQMAPAEVDPAVWTVTRTGVDAGVIVVAAAGNGTNDLDANEFADYRARGDSGAIIVGAGSPDEYHVPLSFSTYGERVDVQGWGSGVFTVGYGDYARYGNDKNQEYTAAFSGTSSASPIVASAAALVSQAYQAINGAPPDPEIVRDLLIETGTPQGAGVEIGPLPNVRTAIETLQGETAPFVDGFDQPSSVLEGDAAEFSAEVVWQGAGGEVEWIWDDGTSSFGNTVEHTFPDDGSYVVSLLLHDLSGANRQVPMPIEVRNVAPVIESTDVPERVRRGEPASFSAVVSDPGDDTVTVTWLFGGGDSITGEHVEHTFGKKEPTSVTLIVTDEDDGKTTMHFNLDKKGACGCNGGVAELGVAGYLLAAVALVRRKRSRP